MSLFFFAVKIQDVRWMTSISYTSDTGTLESFLLTKCLTRANAIVLMVNLVKVTKFHRKLKLVLKLMNISDQVSHTLRHRRDFETRRTQRTEEWPLELE